MLASKSREASRGFFTEALSRLYQQPAEHVEEAVNVAAMDEDHLSTIFCVGELDCRLL
jgi:hypothetical protein